MLFCIRLPNFVQIRTCITEIWRHIDFQDGGRQPCCICFGVMADHPRSAFRGLNSVFKITIVRRINSFGDVAMYRFWRFGLKLPIHSPFGDFLEHISPWRHLLSWSPKEPSLGGSTSLEPFSVRIGETVWPGRVTEKKYRPHRTTKSTKVLYSPIWVEAPTRLIEPKVAWWVASPT